MAWEIGYNTLQAGAKGVYFVSWNESYLGAQPILAVPYYISYIEKFKFTVLDYGLAVDGRSYTYWVTVRNDGLTTASFKLVGGGVS